MERRYRCESCRTKWFTLHGEEPGDCPRCGGDLRPLAEVDEHAAFDEEHLPPASD